jgi:hypothetical protein
MESVWLLLDSGPIIRLDLLGPWPLRREDPHSWLLDYLGFPWILSSESRLINGLPGIKRAKVFLGASFVASRGVGTGARGRGHAEAQNCSWGKLSLVSILRNKLCRPSFCLSPASIQKQRALGQKPIGALGGDRSGSRAVGRRGNSDRLRRADAVVGADEVDGRYAQIAIIPRPRKWRVKSTFNPLAIGFSVSILTDNV